MNSLSSRAVAWQNVTGPSPQLQTPDCRDEVAVLRIGSQDYEQAVVVRDPFIPPAQCPAGSFFHDGLLIVLAGKVPDGINAGEERDRGEHHLQAVVLAQQARAAEAADTLQVPADFRFVVTLVVVSSGRRRPSTPDSRDHLPSFRRMDIEDENDNLLRRTSASPGGENIHPSNAEPRCGVPWA